MQTVHHGFRETKQDARANLKLASRIERAPRLLSAKKDSLTMNELHPLATDAIGCRDRPGDRADTCNPFARSTAIQIRLVTLHNREHPHFRWQRISDEH